MKLDHDFKRYPELTNSELSRFEFISPHKQIKEDFRAKVVKVHDGDTVTLEWQERDFLFPLRFLSCAAPELNEKGGIKSRDWLRSKILGKSVDIMINRENRVGKYGRLLGDILFTGINISQESIMMGYSVPYPPDQGGKIGNFDKEMEKYTK